jgi:hypothetical protein
MNIKMSKQKLSLPILDLSKYSAEEQFKKIKEKFEEFKQSCLDHLESDSIYNFNDVLEESLDIITAITGLINMIAEHDEIAGAIQCYNRKLQSRVGTERGHDIIGKIEFEVKLDCVK